MNSTVLRQIARTIVGSYLEALGPDDLKALYSRIQGQLKSQYRVDFKSLFPDRKNGIIGLNLAVGGQSLQAERSYFAP